MTESKIQSIVRNLPKMYTDGAGPTEGQIKSFNLILFNTLRRLGLEPLWKPMTKLEPIFAWAGGEQGVTVGKRYASYDRRGFCNRSLDQSGWEETIRYFLS